MERIGEYEVERLIGEGGMGKVYEAAERLSGRRVALKVLRAELSRSESGRKLFLNEMRILANLEHPSIVRSLASFESGEDLVLVLEFLDGTTLRQRLLECQRLPWSDAVAIAARVASALSAAHGQKPPIIHRDLKPDNIMLCGALRTADGRLRESAVKVMDFGIAKVVEQLTQTHTQSVGTLQYMSPEQVDARQVDARSDLYALGLVLYEMLTGAPPFTSPSPRELLNLQCTAKPPALDAALRDALPDGLEALMLRMLAKDPDDRPESADEVVRRLTRILEREGADAPAPHSAAPTIASASADAPPAPSAGSNPEAQPQDEPKVRDAARTPQPLAASERIDTRHLVESRGEKTSSAPAAETKNSGVVQMLLVAVVAFALGALVLFVLDPLGARRAGGNDVPSTQPATGATSTPVETQPPLDRPDLARSLPTGSPGGGGATAPIVGVSDPSLPATHTTPDGMVAQLVRAGEFVLGSSVGDLDEQPQRTFTLGDYYIDTTEVTVAAYRECVNAGACSTTQVTSRNENPGCNFGASTDRETFPMNCVSAAGAEAFCTWRSSRDTRLRYRLPTESEWEKAARGTDGRSFPWGEQTPGCALAQVGGCGASSTNAVATSPSDLSPLGVMDLGGRVSEWVLAVYDTPLDERDVARPGALVRNLRGGNWRSRNVVRASDRDAVPVPLDFGTDDIGFRCVGLVRAAQTP